MLIGKSMSYEMAAKMPSGQISSRPTSHLHSLFYMNTLPLGGKGDAHLSLFSVYDSCTMTLSPSSSFVGCAMFPFSFPWFPLHRR